MLMLSCMQSAIIIWNYGRTGQGIYDPYYDLGEFSWSRIAGTDWLVVSLFTRWLGIIGHIVFIVEVPPCAFMESGDILIATVMSQYL